MKVVHNYLREDINPEKAREWEHKGKLDTAILIYRRLLKMDPVNEEAYRRLMVIFRRQKNYRKELAVIRAGIKAFEDLYKPSRSAGANKKIAALSKAILRSTGLADKKGNPLYQKEPIGSWTRRKIVVEEKLKGQVSKSVRQ